MAHTVAKVEASTWRQRDYGRKLKEFLMLEPPCKLRAHDDGMERA